VPRIQKPCPGFFAERVKEILINDDGTAFLSQPCGKCGQSVVAESKGGEWIPKNTLPEPAIQTGEGYSAKEITSVSAAFSASPMMFPLLCFPRRKNHRV
jgi:hypothetical protein